MPLVALTTSVSGAIDEATPLTTARTTWLGEADTTTPASRTASAASAYARSDAHNGTPGRNSGFSWRRLTASTTSASKAQSRTVWPLAARRWPRVLPQLPAPRTAMALTPPGDRNGSRFP
jgi:hypothetical protein